MPTPIISDATNSVTTDPSLAFFGVPTPPPPPPVAPPTIGTAPIVSSTPTPGQGVAVDSSGQLQVATALITMLSADPANPRVGGIWYRTDTSQLCVRHDAATTKRVTLA